MKKLFIDTGILFIFLISVATITFAADVTIPHTFQANTTAVAAEVNDNFSAVREALNDNNDRVSTLEEGINVKINEIHENVSNINNRISTIEEAIDDHKDRIIAIENNTPLPVVPIAQKLVVAVSGGDATSVSEAIDKLLGQGAFVGDGPLTPPPSINTPWHIDVQAGVFNEAGTSGSGGEIYVPDWVMVKGQGPYTSKLIVVNRINLAGTERVLDSLSISATGVSTVIDMAYAVSSFVRNCRIWADHPGKVINMAFSENCEIKDNFIKILPGSTSATGIYIAGVAQGFITENIIDLKGSPIGCYGVYDGGVGLDSEGGAYVLRNTIFYEYGSPNTSKGIAVAKGSWKYGGKISFNTFNFGLRGADITCSVPGCSIANPPEGPSGEFNHSSDTGQLPPFN